MSLRVVVARCPRCSAVLAGEPGRSWLVCGACPTALDGLGGERVTTYRPRQELERGEARLPFFVFEGQRWVAGFRCVQAPGRLDLDVALSEAGHQPELMPAPLGALLARGPEQAARLLARRGGTPGSTYRLVSLAMRMEGEHLVDPVTGWSVLARLVRPLTPG